MPQWMSTIDEMLQVGIPEGYMPHVDGPDGWQAVERFEIVDGKALIVCHLRSGKALHRIRRAPVFLSTEDESGLL